MTPQKVSRAGSLVAVQGGDGRVHLWRVTGARDATQLSSFPDPGVQPGDVIITPGGRAALALTGNSIEWWNTTNPARPVRAAATRLLGADQGGAYTGRGVAAIVGQQGAQGATPLHLFDVSHGPGRPAVEIPQPVGLAFDVSADGRLLAATDPNNSLVNLWDIANPRQPSLLATIPVENTVQGLTLGPHDDQLAVWNEAGTLQLWDITRPETAALTAAVTIPGSAGTTQNVDAVLYLPDGSKLLVSAGDSVYVIDTSPAAIAGSLCSYTGASITRAQWQEFAPRVPYQNPCG